MIPSPDPQDCADTWQVAIENAGTGLWDWDIETGMLHCSRGWWALLGERALPRRCPFWLWSARIHPDDVDAIKTGLRAHFRGDTPSTKSNTASARRMAPGSGCSAAAAS